WGQNHTAARALSLSAESVLLLDAHGKVLFAKKPAEDHAPASLVKLMTLYLACEAIDSGRVQPEEMAVISQRAAQTPRYRMGLRAGSGLQPGRGRLARGRAIPADRPRRPDAQPLVPGRAGRARVRFPRGRHRAPGGASAAPAPDAPQAPRRPPLARGRPARPRG